MLDTHQTVASVVLDHSETAAVFQRHRIDYCCKGGLSLQAASEKAGVDAGALIAELSEVISASRGPRGQDPRTLATPELIAHIVGQHHDYLRRVLPFLKVLSTKVSRVHGDHDPRLRELELVVHDLAGTLGPHLEWEEEVLFPSLITTAVDATAAARELAAMHDEHLGVGELLARQRELTGDFRLPEWACTSYRTLFAELERLETDVLAHVHLENHVLMPRFHPER